MQAAGCHCFNDTFVIGVSVLFASGDDGAGRRVSLL